MAEFQRFITLSEYDHVGIILKNRNEDVVLLESNSGIGVGLMFWKPFILYNGYKYIKK